MQHIDEPLKRYDPVDFDSKTVIMEVPDGKYVKYADVKKFLALIAMKVRLL